MGYSPSELRGMTLYDFNILSEGFSQNLKHDYEVMRANAYLISMYNGLEGKARRKLTPEKMFPMGEKKKKKLNFDPKEKMQKVTERRRGDK